MDKWNLVIDVAECHNCNNCVLAAKDELVGNDFPGYSAPHAAHGPGVIRIERHVRGEGHWVDAAYVPRLCQHCDDGPCLKAGADGAVRKREDGIVVFDPVKAKGRRDLVDACPYGAVVWNEAAQLPQTWFFDAHLLDQGWRTPRCATVCPTGALQTVRCSDEAMAERVHAEGLQPLRPELASRPRVHYRHLQRALSGLVAGSVTRRCAPGAVDCVADAAVRLLRDGAEVASGVTDAFGDFRFDGLGTGPCTYQVVISHPEHGTARVEARIVGQSAVLGDIELQP